MSEGDGASGRSQGNTRRPQAKSTNQVTSCRVASRRVTSRQDKPSHFKSRQHESSQSTSSVKLRPAQKAIKRHMEDWEAVAQW